MTFIAADQTYEVTMPVKHRPNASDFSNRTLAATTRHRERKQTALLMLLKNCKELDPIADFSKVVKVGFEPSVLAELESFRGLKQSQRELLLGSF